MDAETDSEPAERELIAEPSRTAESPRRRRAYVVKGLRILLFVTAIWLIAAYLLLPAIWRHYEHYPLLESAPKTTVTSQGIPGDPLNVGFIGERDALVRAMLDAGWSPADPVTFKTSLGIARSVLLKHPYADAPVSSLFVFGRRQDLAFEKAIGASARRRHHVRFWSSTELGAGGRPLWIGAATLDRSVGFSHRTGQVTHHIDADVDAERDELIAGVVRLGHIAQLFQVTGVGATLAARNGGGDRYFTDGEVTIGVLAPKASRSNIATRLANPPTVQLKEQLWPAVRKMLQSLPGS